jgi:Protein of unknown function (DUF2283)
MKTTYFEADDTLVLHVSDKPIVREVSQDWYTHVSYAEDGSAVEVVVLDARARGAIPVQTLQNAA